MPASSIFNNDLLCSCGFGLFYKFHCLAKNHDRICNGDAVIAVGIRSGKNYIALADKAQRAAKHKHSIRNSHLIVAIRVAGNDCGLFGGDYVVPVADVFYISS